MPRPDPVAGCAFFGRGPLFACTLIAPPPGEPRRSALLAFAFGSADALEDVVNFARHACGRDSMMVVERVASGTDAWPASEPVAALEWTVERDGFVVLAPSVEGRVHMPPARTHHLVQLVAAFEDTGEAAAREALAALATCGMVARVRAVLLGDSGADVDAMVCGPDGLTAGWFVAPVAKAEVIATDPEAPAIRLPLAARDIPRDRDGLLNAALAAYLTPHDNAPRLEAYLRDCPPGTDVDDVRAQLAAAVATVTDALWDEKPAVTWNEAFERRLLDRLQARHPWLAPTGHAALLAYAKWLCWHEGLNA
jgi:hypothetical protein